MNDIEEFIQERMYSDERGQAVISTEDFREYVKELRQEESLKFYALVSKNTLDILAKAKTKEVLDRQIREGYMSRKGIQPKGLEYTLEDFLEGKLIVFMTVTKVK
jgi:hypothetical protein